ncbi:hypothetical protein psyc5s11_35530 [Clostridium gelidum]|uniref:Phage tail protein n=1 Tax=Clostridium gelidum TaxID=704125 RepID=A0ABM7TF86_9CLOT|nr:hypothetical protein [Clostridium gelidum]BCZ47486.1 hypothetical protein psyc5s11_35530 [Clostridium gelidum]
MEIIKTKFGILNDTFVAEYYPTGEVEGYKLEEKSELDILGYKLIPSYGFPDLRKKEFPSVKVYKSGNIKCISLNELTSIKTKMGEYEVEKITFYEEGAINRLFLLDGKLSGYWSEDDEYNLAKTHKFNFEFASFEAKVMTLHFYENCELKSITLWPKEKVNLTLKDYKITGRIGFSLYESGKLKSCEPFRPTTINTIIGDIEAYDVNAIGIHGDENSLKFYEDGKIKSLITSRNTITVTTSEGDTIYHTPKKLRIYSNSEVMDTISLTIEFRDNLVIIDNKYEYDIKENKFEVRSFGEKQLTLVGDLNK